MASAGTPSLVEESIAEETSDIASPEVAHKPLVSDTPGEADRPIEGRLEASNEGPANAFSAATSSPSVACDEQSPAGPQFDDHCIPESSSAVSPPTAPTQDTAVASTTSPKHPKKKSHQNPRVKNLQLSPNKATDR